MTLIECFTESHIDNLCACLRLRPKKMILVGQAAEMAAPARRYEKLLRGRGIGTKITLCDVQKMDIGQMYETLMAVVTGLGDCVVDLTGGDEVVLMAVGAVYAQLPEAERSRIRIEKWDHATNTVRDCIRGNREIPSPSIHLTVEELIELHDGTPAPNPYQPPKSCSAKELDGLWALVSEAPKEWNNTLSLLRKAESRSDSKTRIDLPLAYLRKSISGFEDEEDALRELLGKLHRHGVITDQSTAHSLTYTYNSQLLRYCMQKAGNALEVKVLLEGRGLLEKGKPYFGDGLVGVSLEWEGADQPWDPEPETRNEVDVVFLRGTTPLFISCKNGNVEDVELYKLHTVAHRFGGPYAKKMLIATDLGHMSPSACRALAQRAWDMDIRLVTDAGELSREEWRQLFKKAMQ